MIPLSFTGQTVLITGGTAGIGLATGLAFGALGARCVLTYRLGSADEGEIRATFAAAGAPAPRIELADVSRAEDTASLLARMSAWTDRVDVFISNAPGAVVVPSLSEWSERALQKSIHYSAWPMVAYTKAIHEAFGRWPRYIIGMSSTGPEHYSAGYALAAASKSVMETLSRYLTHELRREDCRVNVIRSRAVRTRAFNEAFGARFQAFAAPYATERHWVSPEEVANAAVALCSGRLDAMKGQILTVDRGTTFSDNLMRLYMEHPDAHPPNHLQQRD